MASFNVRLPASTGATRAPSNRMRKDVEPLAPHILGAHVDHAFQAQQRAHRGGGHAVLPGAGFGDDAALAMRRASSAWPRLLLILCAPVCSRSSAFQPEARAAQRVGEPLRAIERRGPAGIGAEQFAQLGLERKGPGALPGRRAPTPRWAPSTLPAQSGRRRVRSGRWNPVAGSSAERLQGRSQKVGHFSIILFSRARSRCASRHPHPRDAPARQPAQRSKRPNHRPR